MNVEFGSTDDSGNAQTNSLNSKNSSDLTRLGSDIQFDERTLLEGEAEGVPSSLNLKGFRIVKLLGRGGMGIVYEAVEEELNRRVALKVLPSSALADAKQIRRFKSEARAVAQLNHQNIVPIYKVGSDHDIHYYTMQLIEGRNLGQIIGDIKSEINRNGKTHKSDTKQRSAAKTKYDSRNDIKTPDSNHFSSTRKRLDSLEVATTLTSRRSSGQDLAVYRSIAEFAAEIAAALAHAHDHGVIHRDIKPSNILVDQFNKPWVADFGLAIVRDNSVATRPGDIVGTYRYMSPEQATGRRFLIDHRTDIYSLGVTLYELVTQSVPFQGNEPHELLRQVSFDEPKSVRSANPAIPEELDVIITKAISRNPQDRYETAHDFCDDLHRFATGRPILAKRASMAKLALRWMGRHQSLAISASIVCLVTFVASLITTGVIVSAFASVYKEQELTERALSHTNGLLLIAISQIIRSEDPALALWLAVEGARHASGPEVNSTGLSALAETYERGITYLKDRSEGSLDLSPDGRQVITLSEKQADGSRSAALLDAKSGEIVRKFGSQITDVQFHPSGNFVVTASSKGLSNEQGKYLHLSDRAQLWDVRKPDTKVVLQDSEPMRLQHESFSRDGRLLVLPSIDNTVSIYDGFSGERKVVFQKHEAQVIQAVLSADGNRVASLDVAGQLFIWDPVQGLHLGKVDSTISMDAKPELAITMDGKYVSVATRSGASSYDISQNPPKRMSNWREPAIAFCPNKRHAACYWTSSERIQIRDLITGQAVSEIALDWAPSKVTYTRDGRYLVVAMNNHVVVIEPFTAKELFRLKGHKSTVLSVSIDDDFRTIVTSGLDGSIRMWATKSLLDQNSFSLSPLLPIPTRDHFVSVDQQTAFATNSILETAMFEINSQQLRRVGFGKFSGDMHRLSAMILFDDKHVRVIDANSLRKISDVMFPNSTVLKAFRCGGSADVMVQLRDNRWFVWNFEDSSVRRFQVARNQLTQHALSPDGSQIAILGHDGLCTLHSIPDGMMIQELPHEELVTAVAWSKTRGIFTLDSQGFLRRWENSDSGFDVSWTGDALMANSLLVHEHSDQIVAFHGWKPQRISSWNMESGELRHSTDGMPVTTLKANQTSSQILMTSTEKGTALWDLNDGNFTELSKNRSIAGEFVEDVIVVAEVGVEKHAHNHPSFFRSDSGSNSIVFFDNDSKKPVRTIPLSRKPINVSIDQDSRYLLISYETWHAAIGDRKSSTIDLSPAFASNVSVIRHMGSSGNWLVASTDGTAFLLESTGKSIRTLAAEGPPIITGAISRDYKVCAFGDLSGGLRVVDVETGMVIHSDNAHKSAIRQIEFAEQDKSVLSLCEDGRMIRTLLADKSTSEYLPSPGVRFFSMLADRSRALVVLGVDKKTVTDQGTMKSVATFQPNAIIGRAEMLAISSMSAKPILPVGVFCGDVDLVTSSVALFSEDGKLLLVDGNTLEKTKEWDVLPRRPVALRWIGKNRLVALSVEANMSIWNTLEGQLEVEIEHPVKILGKHMSFRDQWTPLDATNDMLIGLGRQDRFQAYPQNIYEYSQRNLPRELTADESLLYLNQPTLQPPAF